MFLINMQISTMKKRAILVLSSQQFLQHFTNESKWPFIVAKNTTDGGDQKKINNPDWIFKTLIRVATPSANEKLPPHQWTNEKSEVATNEKAPKWWPIRNRHLSYSSRKRNLPLGLTLNDLLI